MIIVLASTKEVISDFMINMNIDSLGENHIDVALKVPFSTFGLFFIHIFRNTSHGIVTKLSNNINSDETIFGIISQEVHLFKGNFRVSK